MKRPYDLPVLQVRGDIREVTLGQLWPRNVFDQDYVANPNGLVEAVFS